MNTTLCTTLSEHGIHVWRFPLAAPRQEIVAFSHWLSVHENVRLNRMRTHVKRDKRIVAWGRLRYILSRYLHCAPGDIQMMREGAGRPEVAFPEGTGIQVNLSHSGSLGLVGISRNAVGVDIEKVNVSLNVKRLATRFFASNEAKYLLDLPEEERTQQFFRLWVLKEAYLKAHGANVPVGLSQCELELGPEEVHLRKSDFESQDSHNVLAEIPVTVGYTAALAGLQEKADISVFDL